MVSQTLHPWIRSLRPWGRRGLLCALRGLPDAALAVTANIALIVLSVLSVLTTVVGVGLFAVPVVTAAVRRVANLRRRLAGTWAQVPIPVPYRPEPDGRQNPWQRYRRTVTDPATWRDLLWLLLEIPVGLVLGLVPTLLILYGLLGVVLEPVLLGVVLGPFGYAATWPVDDLATRLLVFPQGVLILATGLAAAPLALRVHALFARWLLAPTRSAALTRRVRDLTESRAETVDAQAAELRRIERDLHDGAQARMVAVGMTIGLAEELVGRDPQAAQRLLGEAREASSRALVELRDLVRGIHPPVLAERGLSGAVQALALAVPLPVRVRVDLPGRPAAPVESAVYFAVAEALANVTKHSRARTAWIELTHTDGRLVAVVGDDGDGGADPDRGTGLPGIGRRLAAFDGTMTVTSPPGGPTVVTMELSCELSSRKTWPSSGTA
ncbi:sensor domain-containing protein [Micromonospora sp. NPDC049523]|uniref:sensor histidine kinase n=1 Tax=Micromonospora sp. NPDC049523 TaxID=3155921 RepID=UPI0034214590